MGGCGDKVGKIIEEMTVRRERAEREVTGPLREMRREGRDMRERDDVETHA